MINNKESVSKMNWSAPFAVGYDIKIFKSSCLYCFQFPTFSQTAFISHFTCEDYEKKLFNKVC